MVSSQAWGFFVKQACQKLGRVEVCFLLTPCVSYHSQSFHLATTIHFTSGFTLTDLCVAFIPSYLGSQETLSGYAFGCCFS